MQLKILFLDDEAWRVDIARRTFPAAALVHVQNVTSCLEQLREGPDGGWDVVSLDHDLGGERFVDSNRDDCGMYVVRWLAKFKRPMLRVVISLNMFLIECIHVNLGLLACHRLRKQLFISQVRMITHREKTYLSVFLLLME